MKAGNKVPKIGVSKKKPVFSKETFLVIHKHVTPKIGHDAGAVEVVSAFFTAKGVADLYGGVSAADVTENLEAILGAIKPAEEENDGGNNIHNYLDAAADEKFVNGDYEWMLKVSQLVGYLRTKGYGPKNLASPAVVDGFIAANNARYAKAKELEDRKPEEGFGPRQCERSTHRGANPLIQPTRRYKVRWEDHEPVGRLTYEGGGEMIVAGDVLMNKEAGWKILNGMDPGILAKADLLEVAKASYRFYCPPCQHAAIDEAKQRAIVDPATYGDDKPIFRTFGGVLNVLEAMRLKIVGRTDTVSFEVGATTSNKPRGLVGDARKMRKIDRWGRGRSHREQ